MGLTELENTISDFLSGNKKSFVNTEKTEEEYLQLGKLINRLIEANKKVEYCCGAMQSAPVPVAVLDKNLRILDANDYFVKITGYPKETLASMSLKELYSVLEAEKTDGESVNDAIEKRQKVSGRYIMNFRGVEKTIKISVNPSYDDNGSLSYISVLFLDVTETEAQKVWYEGIIDAIPFPVHIIDEDMKWTYMNTAFEKALMANNVIKSREWARGRPCSTANSNICNTEECGIRKLKKTGNSDFCESYFNDGHGLEYKMATAVIRDKKGNTTGYVETCQDITDLLNKTAFYESILDAVPYPIHVTDNNMKWTYMNKAFEKLLLESHTVSNRKSAYGMDCCNANASICNTEQCGIHQLRTSGKNETFFDWMGTECKQVTATVKDAKGNGIGYVETVQDITDIVRPQKYLEAEFDKVATNLKCIAEGRPQDLKIEVGEADKYTKHIRKQFIEVNESVSSVNESLLDLVNDIQSLVNAGEKGNLEFRVDSTRYQGAYIGLVESMNNLLESVALPLKEGMEICDKYSNADFSARFSDNIKVEGDFHEFKTAIDNIGISVAELLAESSKVTNMIASNSGEINKGTDDVAKAAEGVANTSQKTADLTKDLLKNIEEVNRQIADLSASNEEIAGTSQEVYKATNHVVEIGKEAQSMGNDASTKMSGVEKIAKESVEEIKSLTEQIKEVGKIVKLINDIAGQINLLALNAAIEAARAGEHGRGFAVVAGEVKNLAAEARAATDSIENVVSKVQSGSEKTAQSITSANDEIMEGVNSVTKAIEALNTIIKSAGQVSNDVGEITKAIEDQANISNNIVKSMEAGTQQTKNVQKEAGELAALAEETSASIEEIGSAMHEVNSFVKELEETNFKFKY
ncbi:methyl-accepting chemotaxis protein [Methanomicrobium sp. W14]|uniref:methyl-accepting chemotaxis protein n=1 Tax=Methanomicrobium sp. W14 TaxID=2817839 RepID=UPI001AE2DA1B|nr:methyl-accepting chemotaxis protein [Methanomicrobium sp. W14]MBP2133711.1 methyl-accepting chemotaxis protein [Methanomicrobium sp. W14]